MDGGDSVAIVSFPYEIIFLCGEISRLSHDVGGQIAMH